MCHAKFKDISNEFDFLILIYFCIENKKKFKSKKMNVLMLILLSNLINYKEENNRKEIDINSNKLTNYGNYIDSRLS